MKSTNLQQSAFFYDAHSLVASTTDPLGNVTVSGPWANSTVQYVYDNYSRLTSKIVGSATQSFVFDNLGKGLVVEC